MKALLNFRFGVFCLGICIFSIPVYAIDYTTHGGKKQGAKSDPVNECSRNDLRGIELFDKVAFDYIKKYNKVRDEEAEEMVEFDSKALQSTELSSRAGAKEARKMSEDLARKDKKRETILNEARAFFESSDYDSMKPVYKKCNKDMPQKPRPPKPFWVP
tara:strand:+ start:1065 stop:1541 length:477 start_codon:yes stop_codon:yes gene_type:complete